jgi:hypothetical protein
MRLKTRSSIADYLGCSPNSLDYHISQGARILRNGSHYIADTDALDEYLGKKDRSKDIALLAEVRVAIRQLQAVESELKGRVEGA